MLHVIPNHRVLRMRPLLITVLTFGVLTLSACGAAANDGSNTASTNANPGTPERAAGQVITVQDTMITATTDVAGVADAMRQATLSTKWMGTVTDVMVHEGDNVRDGQTLVRIDARELTAKSSQIAASIADADAMYADAATNAARFKALYADSAATRAQYDAAVTGLARADAARIAARAAKTEMEAMSSYATIQAPFAGVVTMRYVDPGAFAAPGAPLITVQDVSTLRLTVSADANAVRGMRRGQTVNADINGESVTATIEGIVPGQAGNLFTVNATVRNRSVGSGQYRYRAGSAATLHLPMGTRNALMVPSGAIITDGDLTGVVVRTPARDERRWVRLGTATPTYVEVISGLTAGEQIVVPAVTKTGMPDTTLASQSAGR